MGVDGPVRLPSLRVRVGPGWTWWPCGLPGALVLNGGYDARRAEAAVADGSAEPLPLSEVAARPWSAAAAT